MSDPKFFCVIGKPLHHTLSPLIQNFAFRHFNLNCIYIPIEVQTSSLKKSINTLREKNIQGFNVTIPYKQKIMKYLDSIDPIALDINAVNTVVLEKNQLKGYNTDINGIKLAFKNINYTSASNVTVIGAGGTSRSVIVALKQLGLKNITILNRTPKTGENLVDEMNQLLNTSYKFESLYNENIGSILSKTHILINTTPIGLYPKTSEIPINKKYLNKNMTVFDVIYRPLKTSLLKEADIIGAKTISGLEMLVGQGCESFKLWTGLNPPFNLMFNYALNLLSEET